MTSPTKPVLGYWAIRGLGQPIRALLNYAGIDFEDKAYGFGPAPDYNGNSWFDVKFTLGFAFPNLPYLIDENVKVTESKGILKYVAATKAPALVPATPQLQVVSDMVEGVLTDIQKALIDYAYAPADKQPGLPEETVATKLEQLVAFLGQNNWAVGNKISYIDFYLAEVLTQYRLYKKEVITKYPVLESYLQRFESLPELKEYVKASAELKAYSPDATVYF